MNRKEKIKIIISAILATIFVAIAGLILGKSDNGSGSINQDDSAAGDSKSTINSEVTEKKLSVLPDRCRGCGKCVRVDSEHFAIDESTRKAVIISEDNLDSTNLTAAISMCHDGAIKLS